MSKKIALVIGAVALLFTGCASDGHCDTSESPRFVQAEDADGLVPGDYVVVDIKTGIEYVYCPGKSMTPLLDTDGKPLKYNAETGDN